MRNAERGANLKVCAPLQRIMPFPAATVDYMLNRRRVNIDVDTGLFVIGVTSSGMGTGFMLTGPSCETPQLPEAHPLPDPQELQVAGQTVCGTSRQTS